MDRAIIFITLLVALVWFLSRNRQELTYSKLAEVMIALTVFSFFLPRATFPVFLFSGPEHQLDFGAYGPLGIALRAQPYHFFAFFFLFIAVKCYNRVIPQIKTATLVSIIAAIIYVFANPTNEVKFASVVPVFYFATYFLVLYYIVTTCSYKTILNGIFTGLAAGLVLNLVLSIMFPLLNMKAIVKLFNSSALLREGSRAGAVGTFDHSNTLGVFISYCYCFFLACILTNFKKKQSIAMLVIAVLIILLSKSRSALMSIAFASLLSVVLYKFKQYSIFSPRIFFKAVLPVILLIATVFWLTPIADMFLKSDADDMMLARGMHYLCGYEMFSDHPLFGVGWNSHLKYMSENIYIDFNTLFSTDEWLGDDFMYSYPIHNIWLIMLCELGLVGFSVIVYFIARYFYRFKKRIAGSTSANYHIILITVLGILCCLLVQGNSDWAPLREYTMNLSVMFMFLAGNYDRGDEYGLPEKSELELMKL